MDNELTLNVNNVNITDNLTDKYALKDHDHDERYALKDHNHDDKYSSKTHNHDAYYSSKTHNHDAYYASKTHNHDAYYAAKDHTHQSLIMEQGNFQINIEPSLQGIQVLQLSNGDIAGGSVITPSAITVVNNTGTATTQIMSSQILLRNGVNNIRIMPNLITINNTPVSLEGHTHEEYAEKDHTHEEYAEKDHTHSDIQDLIASYEKRIVFLELALQIANKYQVFWEDNEIQYVNESDIFDIIVGYYFTFFKLKDRFIGTKVFLTINEEEYPGENNYSIKYVNYQYGKSDPQTFGSNHSLALRGDKKYCKFECLYENIYPGDIPLFMNVSFIYGSMSKNYKLSIYQNDYPDDYYDKFFNL